MEQKSDTNPKIRFCEAGIRPVSSWIDEGRSKRLPVNFGRSASQITVLADQIVHVFLEIHVLRVPGPVSFSSDRISIPKIDKRHTAPLRRYGHPQPCQAGSKFSITLYQRVI